MRGFQLERNRVAEGEASVKITEEVLRHLIVRKPEKAAPVTAVAPPPPEVVPEPVAAETNEAAGRARRADGEEETKMSNLHKALLIGRLTTDPEMRYTQSGAAGTNFILATNSWSSGADREGKAFIDY